MPINIKARNEYDKLITKLNYNPSDFDKKVILESLQKMYNLGFDDGYSRFRYDETFNTILL